MGFIETVDAFSGLGSGEEESENDELDDDSTLSTLRMERKRL